MSPILVPAALIALEFLRSKAKPMAAGTGVIPTILPGSNNSGVQPLGGPPLTVNYPSGGFVAGGGTSQPVSQPVSQPTSQPVSQPTSQPVNQPTSQPVNQPTSQPVNQPTSQPVSQPVNSPAPVLVITPVSPTSNSGPTVSRNFPLNLGPIHPVAMKLGGKNMRTQTF